MFTTCSTGTASPSSARLWYSSCSSSSSDTLSDRSFRMDRAPFISRRPPITLLGMPIPMTVPRVPTAFVMKPAMSPPRKPPMKKIYIVDSDAPIPRRR